MSFEVKDLWQQVSELRDTVQNRLDKIQKIYGLEKRPTCSVAATRSPKGELLAIVEIPEGGKIDDRLRYKFTGTPQTVAKLILPILTSLLIE
jgi:hypothetical protein